MIPPAQDPFERLRASCVRVLGAQPGCGFPIAPGWLVTCLHVVGRGASVGDEIAVCAWRQTPRATTFRHKSAENDLALLEDPSVRASAAVLGEEPPRLDELLRGIGFPVVDGRSEFDVFTVHYEGETRLRDPAADMDLALLKLKCGGIDYGFSGGPLWSPRTGQVVGVTRLSKNPGSPDGGWAVPAAYVRALCRDAGIALARVPAAAATPDMTRRISDLLLALPKWNSRRDRTAFLERALGRSHRILQEVELEGSASQVAWDIAKACEDYPEPPPNGLSPRCALLVEIRVRFGPSSKRDTEIVELRAMLGCAA
jgi:hypothetical protein